MVNLLEMFMIVYVLSAIILLCTIIIILGMRRSIHYIKDQRRDLMLSLKVLAGIGKAVIPVKVDEKPEAVQQVEVDPVPAKKKADQEAAAKEESQNAKLNEIADLEKKLADLKGGQP